MVDRQGGVKQITMRETRLSIRKNIILAFVYLLYVWSLMCMSVTILRSLGSVLFVFIFLFLLLCFVALRYIILFRCVPGIRMIVSEMDI